MRARETCNERRRVVEKIRGAFSLLYTVVPRKCKLVAKECTEQGSKTWNCYHNFLSLSHSFTLSPPLSFGFRSSLSRRFNIEASSLRRSLLSLFSPPSRVLFVRIPTVSKGRSENNFARVQFRCTPYIT